MHPNILYGAVYNSQGTQATKTSSHRRREAKDVLHTFMDYDRNPHKRMQWCRWQQQGRGLEVGALSQVVRERQKARDITYR